MKLLLDTQIVLWTLATTLPLRHPRLAGVLRSVDNQSHVSVVSLWEIAIKTRLGKLRTTSPVESLPSLLAAHDVKVLALEAGHALTNPKPSPSTRDPFDRVLVAIAQVEGMRLVTTDRALLDHPVAYR